MRRILLVLMLMLSLTSLPMSPAEAAHAPAEHCSETGDVCQDVRERNADFKFRISLASRFFTRYRLCVKDPNGTRECHRFRVQEGEKGTYFDKVSWLGNFDAGPAGDYSVVWIVGGDRLGKRLGFHTQPG